MGLVKSTTVKQVAEAVRQVDPDERVVVTLGVGTGGNPWLSALLCDGVVDGDTHFLTLTHRSVLFHRVGSRYRPGRLGYSVPRPQAWARISVVRRGLLWSSLWFRLPGETGPTRLNVRRVWRPEMDRFVDELAADATER